MKKIRAVIPVRSGSVRVPNKNFRPFGDTSLLELKIAQLKRIEDLRGIVISSDSNRASEIALQQGCEFQYRPPVICEEGNMCRSYRFIAENIQDTDLIFFVNCTNPFFGTSDLQDVLSYRALLRDTYVTDSINSAVKSREFLWDGRGRVAAPLNYSPKNQVRSQDLPPIYGLTFAANLISREVMLRQSNVVGDHPFFVEAKDLAAFDIDTMHEFEYAEYLYKGGLG